MTVPKEFVAFPGDVATVAFAGDWHGNGHFAKKAILSLPSRVDVLVHTGDFGFRFTDQFLDMVNGAARKQDLIVMFVEGNHDNHEMLQALEPDQDGVSRLRPRVWHLPRGFRWSWMGVKFMALGGAHSVDRRARTPGFDWWEGETLSPGDVHRAIAGGPVDVMITHDAPAGHPIPGLAPPGTFPRGEILRSDQHRQLLAEVVAAVKPKHLWHGHYHSRYTAAGVGGVQVHGLDADGYGDRALIGNLDVVDMANLAAACSG